MISTKEGKVTLNGSGIELMADFSIITRNLYMSLSKVMGEDLAKLYLAEAYKDAFKSDEEIWKKAVKAFEIIKSSDSTKDAIKKMMKDIWGE